MQIIKQQRQNILNQVYVYTFNLSAKNMDTDHIEKKKQ